MGLRYMKSSLILGFILSMQSISYADPTTVVTVAQVQLHASTVERQQPSKGCSVALEGHESACTCSVDNSLQNSCYRAAPAGVAEIYCKTGNSVTSCSWEAQGCHCKTAEYQRTAATINDDMEMEEVEFE